MALDQPFQARIRHFSINGVPLHMHLFKLMAYETIFKPYFQATAIVIDKNQVMSNSKFVGGAPCSFAFDCGEYVYEQNMFLFSLHGEKKTDSKRAETVIVQMIGAPYFGDRANIVQQSFSKGISGTQAIKSIHSKYIGGPIRTIAESMGPIAVDSYISAGMKPFSAIEQISKRLNYPKYQTGKTLYFQNRDGHNVGPLEGLFDQMGVQETFIEKTTWGSDFRHNFGYGAEHMIVAAQAEVDFAKGQGSMGSSGLSTHKVQEQRVFDFLTKNEVVKKMASQIAGGSFGSAAAKGLSTMLGSMAGGHGGRANYQVMNAANLPKETDPSNKTMREQLYDSEFKNGPMWTVKVPLTTGINVTVGKGVNADILVAVGDVNAGRSHTGGNMLVTDLCHEVRADGKGEIGLTTFQAAKGGYNG